METRTSNRSPFLIIILALFSLAILVFLGVLVRFVGNPSPTPSIPVVTAINTFTPIPSPSPTNTSTVTLTPRPTWTLRPSVTVTNTPTPTVTPTKTIIPTITAARAAQLNTFYQLKPWDLTQQTRTIELLKADTVLQNTDESYSTLAFAEGEAGLLFPEAVDATQWRWDRAYNLLRVGDPQAMPLYADLIQSAISTGQVRAGDLPVWFSQYETRLELLASPLPPQPGELSRQLLELKGEGSAYLWLVETPIGVNVFPIYNDVDYAHPHENDYLYDDLTGDGVPELIIYRSTSPGNTLPITPHFFDLSTDTPNELPIQEYLPIDFGLEPRAEVAVQTGTGGNPVLQVTHTLLPACPTYVTQTYSWDGQIFKPSPMDYELVPVSGQEAYCEIVLEKATAGWGPDAAIKVTLPLLDVWPPDTDLKGYTYPADASDELRYRLGILYALANQPTEAIRYMTEIINSPSIPESTWIIPAEEFIDAYQDPEDVYTACLQAHFCNLRDAFRSLVLNSGISDPDQLLTYLQNNGVSIRSGGFFDFDLDGQDERWVIILPSPGSKLEFWILPPFQDTSQAVFAQVLEGTESFPYYHEPVGSPPVVQFELHKGFIFKRLADTLEPYIEWVDVEFGRPTIILDGYNRAVTALMNGEDPKVIQYTLLELMNSPRFKGDCIAFNICDQFHYTLGFVHQLNGEFGNAIDQYLWVWRNYPESSYTQLARLKLDYFPLPTYTRTPIRTPIPTVYISPTPTMTRTPTATATASATATTTPTPTETGTSTPTSTP